jgi:O-antigen/teichoic acid export membrane protein
VVNITLIVVFHLVGFGLSGVIYAFILSNLTAFISGIFYLRKLFPEIKYKDFKPVYEIKDLIFYSVPLLFIDFLHYFLIWTNSLLLGVLSTTKSVGIYRAASQLPLVMTIFMLATNSIYAPLAANLYKKTEMKRLENIFKTTTRWVIYITVPIFILIIFSSKELMMIFGRDFVQTGWIVLIILSFGQLINCMTAGVGMTLTMTAKQKLELFNSAVMLSANILLCYLLIPKYGAIGAAIANCVGISLINFVRLAEVKLLYNMHPFTSVLIKYTLPSSVSIIILFFLNTTAFQTSNIFTFFIKLCTIFIIFMAYFLKKAVWTTEDLFVYNKVKNIISKKANPAKI